MSFKDDFNLFVGAKYGIFKGIKAVNGKASIQKSIQSLNHLSKNTDITALAWSDEREEEILIGLSNQIVKMYDTNGKAFTYSTDASTTTNEGPSSGSICGISRYDGAVITATESGHVRVLRFDESECVNIHAGKPISKMRHSKYSHNVIGTGGLENDLKLWDLNTGKCTFQAKNVPHDFLNLQVKVWASDHVFLPSPDKVVVGSRYGYVRLYDPKAQRRPVIKIELPEMAISCITSAQQDHTVLCGLAKGNIITVDLRNPTAKNVKGAQTCKGFLGSVCDVICHPSEPYIASVSLDRFLRIHDANTKSLLLKEYLVSRMTTVLMRSTFTMKSSSETEMKAIKRKCSNELEGESDAGQDLDDLFHSMEEVVDRPTRKTAKVSSLPKKKSLSSYSKKKKQLILANPFAAKSRSLTDKKVRDEANLTPATDDSDDDIMIVSESITEPDMDETVEDHESQPDEAEGESDELDDNSGNEKDEKVNR